MQTARIGEWGQKNPRATKKVSGRGKYGVRPRRFPKFLAAMQEGKRGWPSLVRSRRTGTTQLPDNHEFEAQERAFMLIPESDLEQYRGQFVASRDGQIVDHDHQLAALTNRFFSQHGDVAVYITRIGEPIQGVLRTPMAR